MHPAGDSEGDDRKRDPRDFALWKRHKPDEPATASWPTPWGRGPSGLASRVLGDGDEVPRADVRHPRRRARPDLPAPRERDRAVVGGRRRVRAVLDAQRLGDDGRREDVEVAGQYAARDARWSSAGVRSSCATTSAPRTTARTSSSPRRALDEAATAYRRIENFVEQASRRRRRRRDSDVPRRVRRGDGRRPRRSRWRSASCTTTVRAGNTALAAGDDRTRLRRRAASVLAMTACSASTRCEWQSSAASSDLTPVVDALVQVALEQRAAARERKDYAAADAHP